MTQAQLSDTLKLQGGVLASVEASLAKNAAVIEANFQALDARVAALTAALAKLS